MGQLALYSLPGGATDSTRCAAAEQRAGPRAVVGAAPRRGSRGLAASGAPWPFYVFNQAGRH